MRVTTRKIHNKQIDCSVLTCQAIEWAGNKSYTGKLAEYYTGKLAEYNKTFTDHFTEQEQTTDICNDYISDSIVKYDVMN